jgi:hypothetical protein
MAVLMMLTVAYFAHKNGWGGDIKFWPRVGQGAGRAGRGDRLAAGACGPLVTKAGLPAQPVTVVAAGLVCCLPPTASSSSRRCCPS